MKSIVKEEENMYHIDEVYITRQTYHEVLQKKDMKFPLSAMIKRL